jgi:hypothetical protein
MPLNHLGDEVGRKLMFIKYCYVPGTPESYLIFTPILPLLLFCDTGDRTQGLEQVV